VVAVPGPVGVKAWVFSCPVVDRMGWVARRVTSSAEVDGVLLVDPVLRSGGLFASACLALRAVVREGVDS
jgi:hypothetical protein